MRRNADLPAVPGGIRDGEGRMIAPDPATLPSDELDFPTLWKHPALLFAQTCWGPMEEGLEEYVSVIGQPSYDGIEGGQGELYSSAILMRRGDPGYGRRGGCKSSPPTAAPSSRSTFSATTLRLQQPDSMSGIVALDPRSRSNGRKPRNLLRAHRDGGPPRLDRRRRRGQGGCLRRRLPQLASGAAPRASRGGCRGRRLDGAAQGPALHHLRHTPPETLQG